MHWIQHGTNGEIKQLASSAMVQRVGPAQPNIYAEFWGNCSWQTFAQIQHFDIYGFCKSQNIYACRTAR